ncbi:hypothetical protein HNQ59_003146 [Chitinivorax tropicus]|uniref:Uncharacterized protein n=1 Tax=Chitinivorax tropicus TaxID=714531 RepID=A0A840MMH5_9PROT|nr:hypothetical protein [Chitinivorax tropicus]
MILFATLAADTQDERSMLTVQLDHLRPSDLMVLDSCYPSLLAVCTPAHQRKSPLHPPQA